MADPLRHPDAGLPETIRAFVAVRIPEAVLAQLASLQQRLRHEFHGVAWTRQEAMHITLHFLGNMESRRLPELRNGLRNAAREYTAFDVQLSGVGSFNCRVLWVGVSRGSEPLTRLAHSVRGAARSFGTHDEERAFSAHVTLGRFRAPARGAGTRLSGVKVPPFAAWRVDHCELIRSELSADGSSYTTLGRFPLRLD